MTNCLEVVSSGLLVTNVCVYGSVSCGTCEVLAISEGDVFSIRALVALRQSKINDVDSVLGVLISSNQKVVGFDVSMDDPLLMNYLDSLDHLDSNMKDRLEVELSPALLEEVFQ